jgi:hypothetical protein
LVPIARGIESGPRGTDKPLQIAVELQQTPERDELLSDLAEFRAILAKLSYRKQNGSK